MGRIYDKKKLLEFVESQPTRRDWLQTLPGSVRDQIVDGYLNHGVRPIDVRRWLVSLGLNPPGLSMIQKTLAALKHNADIGADNV